MRRKVVNLRRSSGFLDAIDRLRGGPPDPRPAAAGFDDRGAHGVGATHGPGDVDAAGIDHHLLKPVQFSALMDIPRRLNLGVCRGSVRSIKYCQFLQRPSSLSG